MLRVAFKDTNKALNLFLKSKKQKSHRNFSTSLALAAAPFAFVAEAVNKGCPDKVQSGKQGEDAVFVTRKAFGVADGVGGWATQGVDPGKYSRALMQASFDFVMETLEKMDVQKTLAMNVEPFKILKHAYQQCESIIGSSTAVIVVGGNGHVKGINLGDSALLHLQRDENTGEWKVKFRSEEQTWAFNAPFQLGTGSDHLPEHGQMVQLNSNPGDLFIAGSDGLFDNVFVHEIESILNNSNFRACKKYSQLTLQSSEDAAYQKENATSADELKQSEDECRKEIRSIAEQLANRALEIGSDEKCQSPFSQYAAQYRKYWIGGKLDDTAVAVGMVVPDHSNWMNDSSHAYCTQPW